MLLPLQPLGVFIGGRYAPNNGFSTDWQRNDGIVPSISMSKDSTGSLVVYSGSSQIGKWNQMPELDHLDHLAVVGITLHTQVKDLYVSHAQLLAYLMPDTSTALTGELESAGSVQTKADLESLCASAIDAFAKNYCASMLNSVSIPARRLRGYRK